MWKWECSKSPGLVWEHHSWTSLDETLSAHEDGISVPGFIDIPPCAEEHQYWDDGVPCTVPRCNRRYVRNDEAIVD